MDGQTYPNVAPKLGTTEFQTPPIRGILIKEGRSKIEDLRFKIEDLEGRRPEGPKYNSSRNSKP